MTAGSPRRRGLGRSQQAVLGNLLGRHSGWQESFWPGDGWTYGSAGETIRLLDSLVARGMASRSGAAAGRMRPARQYQLTDAGRAEGGRLFPGALAAREDGRALPAPVPVPPESPGQPGSLEQAIRDSTPAGVDLAVRAVWDEIRRARLTRLLSRGTPARPVNRARSAWQRGALRQEITSLLGAREPFRPGLAVSDLIRETGWSGNAIRRELSLMEQQRLTWRHRAARTDLWSLTKTAASERRS